MRNRIKCAMCGDVIESTYTHDFKWCRCSTVAVDGGREYQRIVGRLEHVILLHDDDSEHPLELPPHSKPGHVPES